LCRSQRERLLGCGNGLRGSWDWRRAEDFPYPVGEVVLGYPGRELFLQLAILNHDECRYLLYRAEGRQKARLSRTSLQAQDDGLLF
jgi:hypothetical protein